MFRSTSVPLVLWVPLLPFLPVSVFCSASVPLLPGKSVMFHFSSSSVSFLPGVAVFCSTSVPLLPGVPLLQGVSVFCLACVPLLFHVCRG